MKAYKFSVAGLILTLTMGVAATAFAQNLRDNLFAQTDEAMKAANAARANILAPDNYEDAMRLYKSAEDKLARKKSIESITEDLNEAATHLRAAVKATRLAEVTLASAIQARNDAESADAAKYADKEWTKAEDEFADAARRLESGKVNPARKKGDKAIELYRVAELKAIKSNYLSEARRLIEQADDEKVKKLAPKTLEKAISLLAQAEKALTENRYDTDEARSLARQAKYEAKHALYLNKTLKQVRDRDVNLEDYALRAERPLEQIAESLDLVVELDTGVDQPTEAIVANIETLRKDSYELSDRRDEILTLETEVRKLETKLGTQSNRLQQQEEVRRKFTQAEAVFSPEEAQVYRQGGNILVRMIGLNFKSGQAVIQSQYFSTLRKVIEAARMFPSATLTVEGHTDSFGSDAANLKLSQERADAVVEYLKANMTELDPAKIKAAGFGESRPVANNETEEGRKKNRRIDLLIKPKF